MSMFTHLNNIVSRRASKSCNNTRKAVNSQRHSNLKSFEQLEDRLLMALLDNLTNVQNASNQVAAFGANLNASVLNKDLPVLADGAGLLNKITTIQGSFQTVSSRLTNFNSSTIANLPDGQRETALESALGAGFDVLQIDGTQVRIKFTRDFSNSQINVSAASSLGDFFGGAAPSYLNKIALAGNANGTLAPGSRFEVVFGANSSGFFVEQGDLFAGTFQAAVVTTGQVQIDNLSFDASLAGTASTTLNNLKVTLTKNITGTELSNIGGFSSLSLGAGSQAVLQGDFKASVLGVQLVEWKPSLTWNYSANGAFGTVNVNPQANGAPSFLSQANLQSQLISALSDSLGLNKLGINLDPLASVPDALKKVIGFVTQLSGKSINNANLNPQARLNDLLPNSSLQFASSEVLAKIIAGQGGQLLSFREQRFCGN